MADMKQMEIGQIVDYVTEYNDMHGYGASEEKPTETRRMATQADWDALMG